MAGFLRVRAPVGPWACLGGRSTLWFLSVIVADVIIQDYLFHIEINCTIASVSPNVCERQSINERRVFGSSVYTLNQACYFF